jgi:hypothetical protein
LAERFCQRAQRSGLVANWQKIAAFPQVLRQGGDFYSNCAAGRVPLVASSGRTGTDAAVAQKGAKIAQKNEVISELMEQNFLAKKANGGP